MSKSTKLGFSTSGLSAPKTQPILSPGGNQQAKNDRHDGGIRPPQNATRSFRNVAVPGRSCVRARPKFTLERFQLERRTAGTSSFCGGLGGIPFITPRAHYKLRELEFARNHQDSVRGIQ